MECKELNEINECIDKFNGDFYEKVTKGNASQVKDGFDHGWGKIINYDNYDKDGFSRYAKALITLSVAYCESDAITEDDVNTLVSLISEYESNENTKFKFNIKHCLYFNLGYCWHKLGEVYDGKAVETFKKYIYYLILQSSHTSYRPTAYSFRKCSEYLYQSLINEQLNVSSPTTFNDPFDCPIKELLDNGDEIASLLRRAYNSCLKISCFICNTKLPYHLNEDLIRDEKKHNGDPEEYLNTLLWAHYADFHKGVCIKYRFCDSISKLGGDSDSVVSYFKDVKYSDADMSQYSNKDSINMEDAFFLKGKEWEYENELRYLHYDISSDSTYGSVAIPNSVEAIYFGLRCSKNNVDTIRKIMSDKKLVVKDLLGNVVEEKPIKFYQIVADKKHFGRIEAVEI